MLNLIFSLNVNKKLNFRQICKGKFKNQSQCIAFASDSGKIYLSEYNPDKYGQALNLEVLNINQKVSYLLSAQFDGFLHDSLLIATTDSLIAFDVENNKDIFFKEISEGTSVLAFGRMGDLPESSAFVGGNSSIQAFNSRGEDSFWTVTGETVSALTLMDYDNDSLDELVVGTESFDIRVFKHDEIVADLSESQVVNNLVSLNGVSLGYSLVDGTVGVYGGGKRKWRIKSQHKPNVLLAFDINGDGVEELVTGWSNGKVEGRNTETGETIFKESMPSGLVALISLQGMGENGVLLCCCMDGRMFAFGRGTPAVHSDKQAAVPTNEASKLQELRSRKANLLKELKNLEVSMKDDSNEHSTSDPSSTIPADTNVQSYIYVERKSSDDECVIDASVELNISTTNETLIRSVVIFAENVFEGDSFCFHPSDSQLSSSVVISLHPLKDEQVVLAIKVFVCSTPSAQSFHVFEVVRTLPKFSMYFLLPSALAHTHPEPSGSVVLQINERTNRVCLWMNQHFLLPEDLERNTEESLDVSFVCLRDHSILLFQATSQGQLTIRTESIEVAGEMVQDLSTYLNLHNLTSIAHFPLEFDQIPSLFKMMQDLQFVKMKMDSEGAESWEVILEMVVRAEDARIIDDLPRMKRHYMELLSLNREANNTHNIRNNNHDSLVTTYKRINNLIQKSARLRCGAARTDVVSGCKKAVKETDHVTFVKVVSNVHVA